MGDLSPHFSSSEFACKGTKHLLPPPKRLLDLLETIRAKTGLPLTIVSGHRCCQYNSSVGGAPQSRHIYGDAADIPSGRVTEAEAHSLGAIGVGVNTAGWAVHVDVRPGSPLTWYYGTNTLFPSQGVALEAGC